MRNDSSQGSEPAPVATQKVWRYLTFSRFVWVLQKRQLWLSRADLLGDPWEIALAGDQLAHMISHAPSSTVSAWEKRESAMQRAERIIPMWRRETFINCWSALDHESHALWRIYCGAKEGVAIQTTFARLQSSIGSLPLLRVTYEIPGSRKQTPQLLDLATKKRPMFEYEREVRIVDSKEKGGREPDVLGYGLDWRPEDHVASIRVHPEADKSFMETVLNVVDQYATRLKNRVVPSEMSAPPPF